MKKYVIACDKCEKEFDEKLGFKLTLNRLEQTRDPGIEADLCAKCKEELVAFLTVFEVAAEKVVAEVKQIAPNVQPPVLDDNMDDLAPDEKRDVKEILSKMDEAARRSRKVISPSEMLAQKFEAGGVTTAIDSNCAHTETSVIDKSKGITQCNQCSRNLINGKEIS